MDTFVGQGRRAIDFIIDEGTFKENQIGSFVIEDETFGPGAVIGTAVVNNEKATIIANDAMVFNEKPADGIRIVISGFLLTFFSSFGQTFLISLYVPGIMKDFGLLLIRAESTKTKKQ